MTDDLVKKFEHLVLTVPPNNQPIYLRRATRHCPIQRKGHINKENAQDVISYKKNIFMNAISRLKGPDIVPTLLKNHPERHEYVRERDRALRLSRNPRLPPELPFYVFTFAGDVYTNILDNFETTNHVYVKPEEICTVMYLKREISGLEAFKEMLLPECLFYSDDTNKIMLSPSVDSDMKNWSPNSKPTKCKNSNQFIVDFSVIFPEEKVSAVIVQCSDCGSFVETVLLDDTVELAKGDMWHNICLLDMCDQDGQPVRAVIPLCPRSVSVDTCAFAEGLMGVTSLTKGNPAQPAVLVRVRLTFYVNNRSPIGKVVHEN